jgi:ribosome biogenesis GTPase / thiamine phosphate phosphatase
MAHLETLGWDGAWAESFAAQAVEGVEPARVGVAHRGAYVVHTAGGETTASLSGRVLHQGKDAVVGDWVALLRPPQGQARIEAVLPRRTALVRTAAGTGGGVQVLAANVDVVMVVAGLDGDFNPRRVERALVAVAESGAAPMVLLNKADACEDLAPRLAAMQAAAPGVPVHALSALRGDGLAPVEAALGKGRTVVLLGSSGVGKSTLLNRLLGEAAQATADVRAHDSRGRHTTTHRTLFVLPNGGVLIDTPGLRELRLWGEAEAAGQAFGDVEALAAGCRFGDCRHGNEPGCAVRRAVEEGALDALRLASYEKLQAELRHQERRGSPLAQSEEKRRWKVIHKAARHRRPR